MSGSAGRLRLNPIATREVIVDKNLSTGGQVVVAGLELWVEESLAVSAVTRTVEASTGVSLIAGFAVQELKIVESGAGQEPAKKNRRQ